jgi:tyrosyl-tRNA synthetase
LGGGAIPGEVHGGKQSRFLWSVMKEVGLASSASEARRLIQQGAVGVDRVRVSDVNYVLAAGPHTIQVGRRRFMRVIV